jgi:hypothetical protein
MVVIRGLIWTNIPVCSTDGISQIIHQSLRLAHPSTKDLISKYDYNTAMLTVEWPTQQKRPNP